MKSFRPSIIAVAAGALFGTPGLAIAQKPAFHPGLGDLMTAFVQPRHTKLGLAGSAQNWPYAAYELNELSEAFDDVAQSVPKYRNLSVPEMITATVKPAIATLDQAIKAKDFQPVHRGIRAVDCFMQRLPSKCRPCDHRHSGADRLALPRSGFSARTKMSPRRTYAYLAQECSGR